MTHIRRQKSSHDSQLRTEQIHDAKRNAARFLSVTELRRMDQGTYTYINRNDDVKKLRQFFNKKQSDMFYYCLDNKLNPSKTIDKIKADAKLNLEKDGIKTIQDYRYFRSSFWAYIQKHNKIDELIKILSPLINVPDDIIKPVTTVPTDQSDEMPDTQKQLMLTNMKNSLTKYREERNVMESNGDISSDKYKSIVESIKRLINDIGNFERNL